MIGPFEQFVLDIRSGQERLETDFDWAEPEVPDAEKPAFDRRIEWRESAREPLPPARELEDVRAELRDIIAQYANGEYEPGRTLLVRLGAGGGKTYHAIAACQKIARDGVKILWSAAAHRMYADLERMDNFDSSLWHHWLPIHGSKGPDDPVPTTCRFADAQSRWSKRGYQSMDLCKQVCAFDDHIKKCPYRVQAHEKKQIFFVMHQHLSSGLAIGDFDLCIIDELPLGAFVQDVRIPLAGLTVPGAAGATARLVERVTNLVENVEKPLFGKPLLDIIGPLLTGAYAEVELVEGMVAEVPAVRGVDDVKDVPYFWLIPFLKLALLEHRAWLEDWQDWVSRISISSLGLTMTRGVDLWENLPEKRIVLDATGNPGIYKQIFGLDVAVYSPRIKRHGKITQMTGRLYPGGLLTDNGDLSPGGKELISVAKLLSSQYEGRTGVVCHMKVKKHFAEAFGYENVAYFYNNRGTNALSGVDALVVAGTPHPDLGSVLKIAAALDPDRITPFVRRNERGQAVPLFVDRSREYMVTDALYHANGDKTPWRMVKGYWDDPGLQDIYDQMREAEILQSLHRARPNLHDVDVWLLSAIPIDEPLDAIHDDPPIGPPEIHWRAWLKLEPWLKKLWMTWDSATMPGIGYADLAEVVKRHPTWASRSGWVEAIANYSPAEWAMVAIPGGKGRPPVKLFPKYITLPEGAYNVIRTESE